METQLDLIELPSLADILRCDSNFHAKGNPSHYGDVACYVIMPCVSGYRCRGWMNAVKRLWVVDCTRCRTRHLYPKDIRIEEL